MRFLHTESSKGWGGQEIRILREALGLQKRGHEPVLAVNRGGKLIEKARRENLTVYELDFTKWAALKTIRALLKIIKRHDVDLVNTHSSLDAWMGGIAARLAKKAIVRTRHLSTPIRKGLNSYLLYNKLVDHVVTTSSCILPVIAEQAHLSPAQLQCIPTGIDPAALVVDQRQIEHFRRTLRLKPQDILVGTVCFVRSWKGIDVLLKAAELLRHREEIKWVIVGGGYVDQYRPKVKERGLQHAVFFTGHLESPYAAIAAMDIFTLLSTAHEGISQATLQAAYLERPLVTTTIGGLPEVCIEGKTGILVPPFAPEATADAIARLADDNALRLALGQEGKTLVENRFTFQRTLDAMEAVYAQFSGIS